MSKSWTLIGATVLGLSLATTAYACDLAAPDAKAAGPGCARAWMDDHLKLNDLLTVGTHNSYKAAIPPAEMAVIAHTSPKAAAGLDYSHRPLPEQLDAGARQLELDVVYDPDGGRYAHPLLPSLLGETLDPAYVATMQKPGFKVMHIPDIDFRSVCTTFVDCLTQIRTWSRAHPDHAPILITINAKDDNPTPGGVKPLPFTPKAYDAFDAEVRSVFAPSELITPDDVQGHYPTLRDAVMHDAWPTLAKARGKVLIVLDETPEKVAVYRGARRSLEGRVMFISTDEASPAAAILILNDPIKDGPRIAADVRAGYLVRTRADADTVEARKNDTAPRDAALASGAQAVSTDYMTPDPRFAGGYQVKLPGGAAVVCNPLRAATACGDLPIELASADAETRAQMPRSQMPRSQMSGSPSAPAQLSSYLTPETTPDPTRYLPSPPRPGGPEAQADRAVFDQTRALKGTARWTMATDDVKSGLADMYAHFSCALGFKLTPAMVPALNRIFLRAAASGQAVVDGPKAAFDRSRPFVGHDAPICEARTAHLEHQPDYPSGHATEGWAFALILTELNPSRATAILERGRAYGESRVVCGSHTVSAVQAGFVNAAAWIAALHGSADFRADMDAARTELAAAAKSAPAETCPAEAALLTPSPY
jgi:membrane-associated phospholipid phosphatase